MYKKKHFPLSGANFNIDLKSGVPPKRIYILSDVAMEHILRDPKSFNNLASTNNIKMIDYGEYHYNI